MSGGGGMNPCYAECPASTVTMQPPPFMLTIPGPALYCPDQDFRIEQYNPCAIRYGGSGGGGSLISDLVLADVDDSSFRIGHGGGRASYWPGHPWPVYPYPYPPYPNYPPYPMPYPYPYPYPYPGPWYGTAAGGRRGGRPGGRRGSTTDLEVESRSCNTCN